MAGNNYEMYVDVLFGIWVRRGGGWIKVTQVTGSFYGRYTTGGTKSFQAFFNGSVQLGSGIEAFGVTIDETNGGVSNNVDFGSVQWSAAGAAAGTRTALPNGATTTITVRPK